MIRKIAFITCFYLFITGITEAQVWNWARKLPGSDSSGLHGIATSIDVLGNQVVLTGADTLFETDGFDGHNRQFYVSKYDRQGVLLWSKHFSHSSRLWACDLTTDSAGNIYTLTGRFTQANGLPYNGPSGAYYLTKLNTAGDIVWVKSMGALTYYAKRQLKSDGNDIYIFAGINEASFTFADTVLTVPVRFNTAQQSLLAKLDSSGNRKWQKLIIDSTGFSNPVAMNLNKSAELAITGNLINFAWLDTIPLPAMGIGAGYATFYGVINTITGKFKRGKLLSIVDRQPERAAVAINDSSEVILPLYSPAAFTYSWTGTSGTVTLSYPAGYYLRTFRSNNEQLAPRKISAYNFKELYDLETGSGNTVYASLKLSQGALNSDTSFLALSAYTIDADSARQPQWMTPVAGSFDLTVFNTKRTVGPSISVSGDMISYTGGSRSNLFFGTDTVLNNGFRKGFLASQHTRYCRISGKVFIDANNNGINDPGEIPLRHILVRTATNYFAFTNNEGEYTLYVDTGSHAVSLQNPVPYYTSVPLVQTVSFLSAGQSAANKHLALQAIAPVNDLQVDITPITPARPGFNLNYLLTIKNKGTTTQTGTYSLKPDQRLSFIGSDSLVTAIGDSLVWNHTSLRPYESRVNRVTCRVNPATPLSTLLKSVAYVFPVSGDSTPVNNVDTAYSMVTGSYDPNDKLVYPLTDIHIDSAQQGKQFIEYTIRFQNTGTDTAFQVRIADSLSEKLNLVSIELISSSHPVQLSRRGQRTYDFYFPGILLPDSTHSEPNSHGFVKFRIKPLTAVTISDTIFNFADIYFDYNSPVRTNTTKSSFRTTVITGTGNLPVRTEGLLLFPNPARDRLIYQLEQSPAATIFIRLFDAEGRLVFQRQTKGNGNGLTGEINVSGFAPAVYIMEISSRKEKWIKELLINR